MTTPVLIEAPPGIPVGTSSPLTPTLNPALAAEFAAMLTTATLPTVTNPAEPTLVPPTLAAVAIGDIEATPLIPVPSGREGETAVARSAPPTDLPDSAPDASHQMKEPVVAPELAVIDVAALAATFAPAPTLVGDGGKTVRRAGTGPDTMSGMACVRTLAPTPRGSLKEKPVEKDQGGPDLTGCYFDGIDSDPIGGPALGIATEIAAQVPAEPTAEAIPDAHLSDVVTISGPVTSTDADARREGERPADPEAKVIEATDRPADFASREIGEARTAPVATRPLDRSERTRIVHEVIDRVSRHVETLALSRSKEPLTIRLEPADLGRIVVELSREAGSFVAEMSASDPRVAETLDRHRGELAAGLAARGHAEARITVHSAPASENPGFDLRQGSDQGQTPQQQPRSQPHHHTAPSYEPAPIRTLTRVRTAGLDLEI